jgi:putative hydrolase of the HAD superfamily
MSPCCCLTYPIVYTYFAKLLHPLQFIVLNTTTHYQHLFFDLDHTLWDFEANSKATLLHLYQELELEKRGVADFNRFHQNYLVHNEKLWERYRNGYIKQEELRVKRMRLTLLDFKIVDEVLEQAMSVQFLEMLPTRTILFPDTLESLNYLRDKGYKMHLITNGFEKTQHSKLEYSGLTPYFVEVITSEASGSLKPKPEIFEYAFQKTGADRNSSLMIGDTIEVDLLGAKNVGMDQLHVNHLSQQREAFTDGTFPTYTIFTLGELTGLL